MAQITSVLRVRKGTKAGMLRRMNFLHSNAYATNVKNPPMNTGYSSTKTHVGARAFVSFGSSAAKMHPAIISSHARSTSTFHAIASALDARTFRDVESVSGMEFWGATPGTARSPANTAGIPFGGAQSAASAGASDRVSSIASRNARFSSRTLA